ncbi:hypothetical protein FOZ62_003979, partial [Perkinsus olseni]
AFGEPRKGGITITFYPPAMTDCYSPSEISVATTIPTEASTDSSTTTQAQLPSSGKGVGNGAVCKRMESGISLRSFVLTCLNALTTIGLSVPFMFTTAGLLAIPIQALTAVSVFICIRMVSAALRNEKVCQFAEEQGVPPFEREYTFLAEFCGG